MNNKTAPNQMRILLRRMRGESYISESNETTKHELSMRDMLKTTRSLNEEIGGEVDNTPENKITSQDQAEEEAKFKEAVPDVNIKFFPLKVTDKYVIWGGEIGAILFSYRVTEDKETSIPKFDYLDGYNADDETNKEIIKRVKLYFDRFYEYWIDNIIQKSASEQ